MEPVTFSEFVVVLHDELMAAAKRLEADQARLTYVTETSTVPEIIELGFEPGMSAFGTALRRVVELRRENPEHRRNKRPRETEE